MLKTQAIELLGGSITAAAKAIGISYHAVHQWPNELPPRISDRVYAVWGKKNMPDLAQPPVTSAAPPADVPLEIDQGAVATTEGQGV